MAADSATKSIPHSKLDFDKKNPRFADAENLARKDDRSIVAFYLEEVDLRELLDSITASGYIDFDPMLVLPAPNGRYTVLEGNRRLAALKLLHDATLAKALHVTDLTMSARLRQSISNISVRLMKKRSDARAYIGFKHINGPHKWDAMAKAQYATEWLREGAPLENVAKTLGDRNFLVRRLIFGYLVLQQAQANGFDVEDRYTHRFAFSHLYTALTRPGFREYLGLDPINNDFDANRQPIKRTKVRELLDVMTWLYGSKQDEIEPVIKSQNPDLNRLNEILQRPEARRAFLARPSLDKAYEVIEPRSKRFSDALLRALGGAEQTLSLVANFDGSTMLLRSGEALKETVDVLFDAMKQRTNAAKKKRN